MYYTDYVDSVVFSVTTANVNDGRSFDPAGFVSNRL